MYSDSSLIYDDDVISKLLELYETSENDDISIDFLKSLLMVIVNHPYGIEYIHDLNTNVHTFIKKYPTFFTDERNKNHMYRGKRMKITIEISEY